MPAGYRATPVEWAYRGVIVAGFAVTRLAYARAGVRFRAESLDFFAQFLDPPLLRERLVESLWYLHAQPPLLNLLAGLALKASPDSPGAPLRALFLAAGLVSCGALAGILRRLGLGRWGAAALAIAITATPPFLLYENWLFYPHLAQALLLFAGWCFLRSEGRPGATMAAAFWALAALAALRSLFHPLFLVVAAAGAVVVGPRENRARVFRTAALPTALVLGLAVKNLVLFGFFGTSSWGGNSLHRMMSETLDPAVIERGVREGRLSPVSREWEFSAPETYVALLAPEGGDRGIPALDTTGKTRARENAVNYNHWAYPIASRAYLRDALRLIREHPGAYGRAMAWTARRFLDPVTDDVFLRANRFWIREAVEASEAVERSALYRGALAAALAWALIGAARRRTPAAERLFLLFAAGTILWVAATGTALEYGENNRFRYQVLGLAWVLAVYGVRDLARWIRRTRSPGPGGPVSPGS